MKQFFEQMIMDSVSAVKDELISRLRASGNNYRNQEDNLRRMPSRSAIQNAGTDQSIKQRINSVSENDIETDEFPIIAYPDSHEECRQKFVEDEPIRNELQDTLENTQPNFQTSKVEDLQSEFLPNVDRRFFANRGSFSDGEHKITMFNAYNKNRRLNIMILGAVFGLVFCLLMLTFYKGDLPGEVVGIISTVSGIFGSCLKDAYSFEFGSSRGSKEKDDKITSTLLKQLRI